MVTALALVEQYPRPPPTTFLETKLYLRTYADLQDALLAEGSPCTDQILALIKTMDMQKVFGTRNQWDDHRFRQLIWSVFNEGVTYCGCQLTPDDFFSQRKIYLSPRRHLHWKLVNWRYGRRCTAGVSQRIGNGTIIKKIGTNNTRNHKQISVAEVAGLEIKICVTMGEVNQVVVVLVALQEATVPLVLELDLAVVVDLET